MRRSTIKDTNTIKVHTAATAHVGVSSRVYAIFSNSEIQQAIQAIQKPISAD